MSKAKEARRPRRWLRRLAWTVGILGVIGGLVVFVLPTPLARYLVGRQLDGLGITHEGLETVVVDLWNRHVHVGPMRLGGGEAEPASIGTVDVDYSLANVFKRRALIETFTISGVDLKVQRLEDGAFEVNGIRPPAAAPAEPAEPANEDDGGPGIAFGIETLEFLDSRLVLEDYTGGTLTLDLSRFVLEDFLSWEPEAPEQITLEGALNEMPFAFTGTSTLFAKPITVDIEGGLSEATLDKVAVFSGPTGLDQQQGSLNTHGRHAYVLRDDGAIEGTSIGTVVVEAIALATPEGDGATVERIKVDYDFAPTLAVDGTVTLGGSIDTAMTSLAARTATGEEIALDAGTIGLHDMKLTKFSELRAGDQPDPAAASGQRDGPAPSLPRMLAEALVALGQEVLRHDVEGNVSPTLALDGVSLRAAGNAVSLGEVRFEAPGLAARGIGEKWSLEAPFTLAAGSIEVEGPTAASVGSLEVTTSSLDAETEREEATIDFGMRLVADDARVRTADGAEVVLATLETGTEAFEIAGWRGRGTASGALDLALHEIAATLPTGDAAAKLDVGAVDVALLPLTVDDRGALSVRTAGHIDASRIGASLDGATPLRVDLSSAALNLGEASVAPDGPTVAGDLALADLVAELASEPSQRVSIARADLTGIAAEASGAVAVERIELGGLDAEITVAALGGAGTEPTASAGPGGGADGGASELPPVHLGSLVVDGGSRVRILDQSADEAVQLRFDVAGVELGPIDTTNPEMPTLFTIDGSIEETATIALRGSATPLKATPDGDVDLQLEAFPLPLVSPYATQLAGVTIESGELSLDVAAAAVAGALGGRIGLTVGDLFLGEPSEDTAQQFQADFGVPLGFAVGILKDENGIIHFDLPVAGTIDAPAIDFSDVVGQAISGALASVFPGNWFGDDGGGVAIEPVPFTAGSAELSDAGVAVIERLVAILDQKGTIRIRVCGKGAAGDLAALRGLDPAATEPLGEASAEEVNQILELALERGQAVRAYLVEQSGIAADRIGECRTSYAFEGDAPPRAEFQL